MGSYSIGEALQMLLQKSHWKDKITEVRMREEWVEIVGKTIAKYTRNISMNGDILTIYTDVAALKQELHFGKPQLINTINEYFKQKVVQDIIVK